MTDINTLKPGVHYIDDMPVVFVNTSETPLSEIRNGWVWVPVSEVKPGEVLHGPFPDIETAFKDACLVLTGTEFDDGKFEINKVN